MKKYSILTILGCFFFAANAFAWGQQGHSIIALVAQQVLSDEANSGDAQAAQTLKSLAAILGETTIDQGAVWPDQVRELGRNCNQSPYVNPAICSAYKNTGQWHFINTDSTRYDGPVDTRGDLVVLIKGLTHLLKGESTDTLSGVPSFQNWKAQCLAKDGHNCKKEALEFILHFVGDIHQPLHVGALCDAGGNDQLIVFFGLAKDPGATWCNSTSPATCGLFELHQAWDTGLLLYQAATPEASLTGSGFSAAAYAAKLAGSQSGKKQSIDGKCVTTAPDDDIALDGTNGPAMWANESICYMPQVYNFPDDVPTTQVPTSTTTKSAAVTSPIIMHLIAIAINIPPNRCEDDRKSMAGKYPSYAAFQVGQLYYNTNMPTIDERLYWGGHRLATLLKQIYGDGDKLSGEIAP